VATGRGEGLRVRFAKVPGETPKGVLSEALILPAVMRGFSWSEEALHTEYDTVRGGQFSVPGQGPASARRLRTVDDIDTLTITWDPPWLIERGLDPDEVRSTLYAILRSRRAVELLVTPQFGHPSLLRMNVTVRSVSSAMREGEPDTIYYTLRLAEWRKLTAGRRGEGRASKLPKTHKLTATDSLYSLAMHYYHTSEAAAAIAFANGIRNWGKKTPLVKTKRYKVGSKITIPKVTMKGSAMVVTRTTGVTTP
jgi:hypothetical protein